MYARIWKLWYLLYYTCNTNTVWTTDWTYPLTVNHYDHLSCTSHKYTAIVRVPCRLKHPVTRDTPPRCGGAENWRRVGPNETVPRMHICWLIVMTRSLLLWFHQQHAWFKQQELCFYIFLIGIQWVNFPRWKIFYWWALVEYPFITQCEILLCTVYIYNIHYICIHTHL